MSERAEGNANAAARLVYSVEEAADLLGIGRTFMFHLVASGEIDSFKIGKRRKIHRDSLDGYIERLRSEQATIADDFAQGDPASQRGGRRD